MGLGATTPTRLGRVDTAAVGAGSGALDYWGLTVIPVWDPYFQQWGFWEFGIWVPLPGQ